MNLKQNLRILFCATSLFAAAACTSTPQPAASSQQTFYRAYTTAELDMTISGKVAEIENRFNVVAASEQITPPGFREVPRPFSLELRQGRKELSVSVMALIDAKGDAVEFFLLSASDAEVAKQAAPIMRAARYTPARIGNRPVACAATFTIEGAGIPR